MADQWKSNFESKQKSNAFVKGVKRVLKPTKAKVIALVLVAGLTWGVTHQDIVQDVKYNVSAKVQEYKYKREEKAMIKETKKRIRACESFYNTQIQLVNGRYMDNKGNTYIFGNTGTLRISADGKNISVFQDVNQSANGSYTYNGSNGFFYDSNGNVQASPLALVGGLLATNALEGSNLGGNAGIVVDKDGNMGYGASFGGYTERDGVTMGAKVLTVNGEMSVGGVIGSDIGNGTVSVYGNVGKGGLQNVGIAGETPISEKSDLYGALGLKKNASGEMTPVGTVGINSAISERTTLGASLSASKDGQGLNVIGSTKLNDVVSVYAKGGINNTADNTATASGEAGLSFGIGNNANLNLGIDTNGQVKVNVTSGKTGNNVIDLLNKLGGSIFGTHSRSQSQGQSTPSTPSYNPTSHTTPDVHPTPSVDQKTGNIGITVQSPNSPEGGMFF